ncbi:MAG: HAMP domain-containing sensor histidine kinase [Patescibacteria group bacterium]
MNRTRFQLLYSGLVLILVPAIIVVNTLLISSSIRSNYDTELRRKADLTNSVISESVRVDIIEQDYESVQIKIDSLKLVRPELSRLMVGVSNQNSFDIVARSNDVDQEATFGLEAIIAAEQNNSIAQLVEARDAEDNRTRAWSVVTPLIQEENVIGLVSSQLLTTDADELINRTFTNSMIVLVISVVVVILLLLNHFKFVGYAQMLKKQQELNQTMADFLSVATHELKAPMTIIRGSLDNILADVHGPVPAGLKEPIGQSISQTERLNSLVQDLLDVSRIEQGRISYDITAVDVFDIARNVSNLYATRASQKGLTYNFVCAENEVHASADAGRVQEIITNLVDNAVKYTEAGEVRLTLEMAKNKVLIRVKDSGIGMSSDERKRLFQRFYRIQNDQTKEISGTGLGLWIIKKYVEAMGGSIDVDSIKGTGTEFVVELKRADAASA